MTKKKDKFLLLHLTTQGAFGAFIALFLCAIFIHPPKQLFMTGLTSLFIIAVVSALVHQFLTNREESRTLKNKKANFTPLPIGEYEITDTTTGAAVGKLSNENVDFLRQRFLKQGMDDNDFYFLQEIMDVFIQEEQPDLELAEFLKGAMAGKNEMELRWVAPGSSLMAEGNKVKLSVVK
jgi:hypothetical protein